jgi:hypothetical protein
VSRKMVTSSLEAGQAVLLIVHLKTFVPSDNPLTPDAGLAGAVTVPVPEITVHAPVPISGVFPASVAVEAQIVWFTPASAAVGALNRVMVTSSVEAGQTGLAMVQRKTTEPTAKPLIAELGLEGVAIVAVPDTTDHAPVPMAGMLPARVVVAAQIF